MRALLQRIWRRTTALWRRSVPIMSSEFKRGPSSDKDIVMLMLADVLARQPSSLKKLIAVIIRMGSEGRPGGSEVKAVRAPPRHIDPPHLFAQVPCPDTSTVREMRRLRRRAGPVLRNPWSAC